MRVRSPPPAPTSAKTCSVTLSTGASPSCWSWRREVMLNQGRRVRGPGRTQRVHLPNNSFELLCLRTTSEVCVFPSLCAELTGVTAPFHARDALELLESTTIWRLESPQNPHAGKRALRSAAFPGCGLAELSSSARGARLRRNLVILSRCARSQRLCRISLHKTRRVWFHHSVPSLGNRTGAVR